MLVHYDEYWLLSDAPENPNEAVGVTRTVDLARGSGIPSVVLISDACRSRADGLRAEPVHGGPIFPNRAAAGGVDPEVDRFFAARPGEPAHELPVDQSTRAYETVFTEAFLRADDPAEPGLVRCVEDVPVVPNRVLNESGYLERAVGRRLAAHGPGYTQRPQAVLEPDESAHAARARSVPPDLPCPTPVGVGAEGSLEGTIQEILQDLPKLKLLQDPDVGPDFRALGNGVGPLLKAGAEARDAAERGRDPKSGPYTAVAVKGSQIEAFAAGPDLAPKPPLLRPDKDLSILDIVPKERAGSMVLGLHESVVVVPVLAGYLTTVVVEDGRAVSVSLEPAFADRKAGADPLMVRALDLGRRARALVDVAARFGAFVIDGSKGEREERAGQLLETARSPAGFDPALAVQLAYAFAEAGLTDRVALLHVNLVKQLGVALFDTALLAGQLAARPRLVLVHGRTQGGRDPAELREEWLAALTRGARALGRTLPEGLEVALPFYGDTRDDFVRRFDLPLTTDIVTRGGTLDEEFLAFQHDLAEAIRRRAGIPDEAVEEAYGPNPKRRGPLNWEWVQAIFRAIDRSNPGWTAEVLEAFTRDVFLYVRRPVVREAIDALVARALDSRPAVVVGHSLGSVVAYSVLREHPTVSRVAFVTLGSPLAIRPIRDAFVPIRRPPAVVSWRNAFDDRDVVALYPLDESNFAVHPPVENYDRVRNHTANRHGIAGYLDDPTVAGWILDALAA